MCKISDGLAQITEQFHVQTAKEISWNWIVPVEYNFEGFSGIVYITYHIVLLPFPLPQMRFSEWNKELFKK